ncbi:hypothetical protein U1Q18_015773 [Sarracenia purpurea var. burkii]
MKRAQNVAQAVVKTRSSLSSWYCMGARRRTVSPLSNSKEESLAGAPLVIETISESLVTEVVAGDPMVKNKVEACSSSGGSGHDDTDEEVEHIPVNRIITTSTTEDITEELWYELEKELRMDELEANSQVRDEEEATASAEITGVEEIVLGDAVESKKSLSSSDVSESNRFYPPGRIMHIVSVPPSSESGDISGHDGPVEEHIGIYKTPRDLYTKLRLSRTMVNDHYMPMYKRMMERLIRELENYEACSCTS